VVKESAYEIAGREAKSMLEEEGEHHNLICIGCGEVFTDGTVPLQHDVIWEKVICNELVNLTFICGG
jgi:Fe2+ or Zn2+ uptake regulation protein